MCCRLGIFRTYRYWYCRLGAYGDVDGKRLHSGLIASTDLGVAAEVFYGVSPAKASFAEDADGRERGKPTRDKIADRKPSKRLRLASIKSEAMESSVKADAIFEAQQRRIASFQEQCERARRSITFRLDVPAKPKWPGLPHALGDGGICRFS